MSAEKNRLSEAENKLVVGIPPVVRLGIVAIEFELFTIRVQVEDVRIAIAVGYVCDAINTTANLIRSEAKEIRLYFIQDLKSSSITYQVFPFLRQNTNHSARSLDRSRSQSIFANLISENLGRPI